MKKTLVMLSLCALFFGCTTDWGDPTTRNYPISGPFTSLEVSDAFQVTVSDQVSDVVVTVGELAHDNVEVKVVNGKLHIGFTSMRFNLYDGVATAIIPAAVLRDLSLSGASSYTGDLSGDDVDIDLSGASAFTGNVVANKIDFDLSGASSCRGNVEAENIDVDLSGASSVNIGGNCHSLMKIGLSGGSELRAAALNASAVRGNMSGGSYADVTCCSALNVELSGGSTLVYGVVSDDCHPDVNCPSSGGSNVRPR
jgi:hypothetical protein